MIYGMLIVFTGIHRSLETCFEEELMDTALLSTGALLTLYLITGDSSVPAFLCFSSEAECCFFVRSTCDVL